MSCALIFAEEEKTAQEAEELEEAEKEFYAVYRALMKEKAKPFRMDIDAEEKEHEALLASKLEKAQEFRKQLNDKIIQELETIQLSGS